MYYFFENPEIGTVELHYDEQTRKATNMKNGKSTILKMNITEWAELSHLTLVRKSETY